MAKEATEKYSAPRVRKASIPLSELIAWRDDLKAIDVTGHDDAVRAAIDAVADKMLSKVD